MKVNGVLIKMAREQPFRMNVDVCLTLYYIMLTYHDPEENTVGKGENVVTTIVYFS